MARAIAGSPLNLTSVFGGSAYPRVILATLGQREEAVVDPQVNCLEAFLGGEVSADPHADPLRPRLKQAGRGDGVLGLQRSHDGAAVEPKGRDLAGRELQIDDLVLRADDVDLSDIRDR